MYELIKDEQVNGHTKLELIKKFDKVFSINLINEKSKNDDKEILDLIEKRSEAKKNKDFELADSIRSELESRGIILVDTREGTTYKIVGE